jgi:hypothetical protein
LTPAETEIRKVDAENPRRNALFGVVPETPGLQGLDGGVRGQIRTGLHLQFPANREINREFCDFDAYCEFPTIVPFFSVSRG